MTTKSLTSLQNPLIKNIVQLTHKAKERREQHLFVAEGLREVGLALKNGYEALALIFDEKITPHDTVDALLRQAAVPPAEVIIVNTAVFEKIAYRSGVPNVLAVFQARPQALEAFRPQLNPLFLVVEDVEKPGNLGAILRTADAAGVDAVFVCGEHTDVFHPNTIRASLGAIFTVPVFSLSSLKIINWLKSHGVSIFATWLEAAKPLYDCHFEKGTAFVLGAEATGISQQWVTAADEHIIIPMTGQVDSLNVSTSAAIVLFEAVRQRKSVMEGH